MMIYIYRNLYILRARMGYCQNARMREMVTEGIVKKIMESNDDELHARWLADQPASENYWQKVTVKMAHMPDSVGQWEPRGFRVLKTRTEPFVDEVGDPYVIDIWHGIEGPDVGATMAVYQLHTGESHLVGLPDDPFIEEARKRWAAQIRESDEERGEWWLATFGYRYDGRIHPGDRRVKVTP